MVATDGPAGDRISAAREPLVEESGSPAPTDSGASPREPLAAIGDKMAKAALPSATSLPVSMLVHPIAASAAAEPSNERFVGELPETFESGLARVVMFPHQSRLIGAWRGLLAFTRGRPSPDGTTRMVAFDGFRSDLYDEKIERDRRYGTVYRVVENRNAYGVRLEMPRRVPGSALKETWGVGDEMPDYHYRLQLEDQVLSIRASVAEEAIRRLAYISSSFPPDFLTRIEFAQAVDGYVHRLTNKVLEIIVFMRGATGA